MTKTGLYSTKKISDMLTGQLKFFIPFVILLALFSSCDRDMVYEKNIALPDNVWNKDSIIGFVIDINDTQQQYNFYINIRNTTGYKYSNLYIFVDSYLPDTTTARDTLEFILARPDGKWLGKGFGEIKENIFLLNKKMKFPLSGTYKFSLQHGMRDDNLEGIADVGIRVERSR